MRDLKPLVIVTLIVSFAIVAIIALTSLAILASKISKEKKSTNLTQLVQDKHYQLNLTNPGVLLIKKLNESIYYQHETTRNESINISNKNSSTSTNSSQILHEIPTTLRYQPTVQSVIAHLNVSRVHEFIKSFTSYNSRLYILTSAAEASDWLFHQVKNFISIRGNYSGVASVSQFNHSWPMKSVIARIQGSDPKAGIVILGAHIDSINVGWSDEAPGADDNASGTATILEAFRALLDSGFRPKASVEFHWYAAEEDGLRGSAEIAETYAKSKRNVIGMVNFDMTGYIGSNSKLTIISDYTNETLNAFIGRLIHGYTSVGWEYGPCGYACSDHASWTRNGYRASFPHEGLPRSPFIHSSDDTTSNINYERVLEFSKLAVGFAIELAEPSSS